MGPIPLTARHRRLSELEHQVANDPARLREESAARREQEESDLITELYGVFPPQWQEQFLAMYESDQEITEGIKDLLNCMRHGIWKAQEIPAPVAEVWLTDAKATPWLRCSQCQLLLPIRRGFWRNTQTGGWWQSCMRYFARCPGCQGEIVPRGEDRSWYPNAPFPLRPEPPWEFLDKSPGSS